MSYAHAGEVNYLHKESIVTTPSGSVSFTDNNAFATLAANTLIYVLANGSESSNFSYASLPSRETELRSF